MKAMTLWVAACGLLLCGAENARAQEGGKPSPTPEAYDWHKYENDPCGDPRIESTSQSVVEGRVVEVIDGDTLVFSFAPNQRVRVELLGIDAPEMAEPFGRAAKRRLAELTLGKAVWVGSRDAGWGGMRRTKQKGKRRPRSDTSDWSMVYLNTKLRVVTGDVQLIGGDYLDVNHEQIRTGMARHKTASPYKMSNYADCQYILSEKKAREARRGLWRGVGLETSPHKGREN